MITQPRSAKSGDASWREWEHSRHVSRLPRATPSQCQKSEFGSASIGMTGKGAPGLSRLNKNGISTLISVSTEQIEEPRKVRTTIITRRPWEYSKESHSPSEVVLFALIGKWSVSPLLGSSWPTFPSRRNVFSPTQRSQWAKISSSSV